MKTVKKEYHKPILKDMTEYELRNTDGGGFIVIAGVLVAVLLVGAGYTVAAGATLVVGAGAISVLIGASTTPT